MKKLYPLQPLFFTLVFLLSTAYHGFSQVGINNTGAAPNAAALLDIDASGMSPKKGVLLPRLTTAERDAIPSPVEGLMVYNTACNTLNFYNGGAWIAVSNLTGSLYAPGDITGDSVVCENETGVVYSISAVSGATGYNWIVPADAVIVSGQGTTSITVDYGATSGTIYVAASTDCGVSTAASLNIVVTNAPDKTDATAATAISGSSFVANWNAVSYADSYALDVAADQNFNSGFVINDLNVGDVLNYNVSGLTAETNYYYRVRAINDCGTGDHSDTINATTTAACSGNLLSGIVSYWKLDEGSGTADDAVGTNDGVNTSVTYGASYGVINNGAHFNVSGNRLNIGNSSTLNFTTAMTLSVWLRLPAYSGQQTIYSKSDTWTSNTGCWIFIEGTGFRMDIRNYAHITMVDDISPYLGTNEWHHLVMVFDQPNSEVRTYVDNTLINTVANGNAMNTNSNSAYIGLRGNGGGYWPGDMDEMGLWNRALTDCEVELLYNGGAGLQHPF